MRGYGLKGRKSSKGRKGSMSKRGKRNEEWVWAIRIKIRIRAILSISFFKAIFKYTFFLKWIK